MTEQGVIADRMCAAWQGRVAGRMTGKPVEVDSFHRGRAGRLASLRDADAPPERNYLPLSAGTLAAQLGRALCRERLTRAGTDYAVSHKVLLHDEAVTRTVADARQISGEQ